MEKLSRVKKYEELRKNIDTGMEESQNNKADAYDKGISEVNASLFKKMNREEEVPHTPEREKITRIEPEHPVNDFQNEYLDDFLNEVKQYNLKKGTRECEDTQIDILHQLQSGNRPTRSHYVEDIQEEKAEPVPSIEDIVNTMSHEDIAKEVKSLLDDTAKQPLYEPVQETPVYSALPKEETQVKEAEKVQMPYHEPVKEEPLYREPIAPAHDFSTLKQEPAAPAAVEDTSSYEQEMKREKLLHQKLVEETQQLRRQLDEYEDELTDLSDGVEKNNRILNVILCCLILALLGVIAFVIIMLVKAGGTF